MRAFTAEELQKASLEEGMIFPEYVIDQLVAAVDAGKHVILTGPPGTGKTTLAYLAADVARQAMFCTGYLPTTATSEWTTFETIGGLQPTPDGLIYRPGLFVDAIESGRWLVIDELNRSNFDRAFGQLFTVLSGSAVVLPFKRKGQPNPLSLVPSGVEPPEKTDVIRVPANWRIIATMNVFDKNLLFDMSYALMRRFAFIEVGTPSDSAYEQLLQGPGEVVAKLLCLRKFTNLGPAVYLDAAKYATRRAKDGPTESRLIYEVFYAYFLPQFEGMEDRRATTLYRTVAQFLDPPEQSEAQRTISEVLGVELAGLSAGEPTMTAATDGPRGADRMAGPTEVQYALPTADETNDPLLKIWNRLSRPFDVVRTVSALVGLPPKELSHMVGADVATSAEAAALLEAMPRTMRSLATSLQTQTERCIGSIRGPVLWSETMSARASSFGDEGLFVCKTPSRAYDIDENRVLVAALDTIRQAAQDTEHNNDRGLEDPLVRAARRSGNEASRFIDHPSLASVTRERPQPRAIKRTRSGKHRKSYQPALDMLERAANPLDVEVVRGLCDERTRAQHAVLVGLVERLEDRGGTRMPPFRVERGALFSGPVQYYHAPRLGDRKHLSGIVVGQLLVDVPERLHDPNRKRTEAALAARAGGRRSMVVMTGDDLDRAVARAVELASA